VSFNPSGEQVMTTSGDGKFRLWDLASEKLIGAPLPGSDSGGWGVFFPDGRQAIAVFSSGTGVIWNVDPTTWKQQACRGAHRDLTRAEWRSFLPDRRYREVCPERG
jgi:WD40 repeat protein